MRKLSPVSFQTLAFLASILFSIRFTFGQKMHSPPANINLISHSVTIIDTTDGHEHIGSKILFNDSSSTQLRIQLDSIFANEKGFVITNGVVIPQTENVRITWRDLHDSSIHKIEFEYSLSGLDTIKRRTSTLYKDFGSLKPGLYLFQIRAMAPGKMRSKWHRFEFIIPFKWYQTWWFYIFIVSVLMYFAVKYIENFYGNRLRVANTERLAAQSQLSALRSQMNPHFVFNSLNNIQQLIYTKDFESSNAYISKLSALLRRSLEYSRQDFITLEKEIQYIEDYLELERIRFGDHLEYHIIVLQKKLNIREYFIPPLFIQPIIENSIKHGFKDLNFHGIIQIYFEIDEQNLIVKIKDNGLGLQKENQNKRTGFSIKIIHERIALLNAQRPESTPSSFELKPNENNESGVTVILKLPLMEEDDFFE